MQGKPIEAIERGQHRAPIHRNIFVGTVSFRCCHELHVTIIIHFKILRKENCYF